MPSTTRSSPPLSSVVDINTQSLKIAFLEILISIIQNPPEMLLNSEDFIEFLRNEVLTNTIVNATSAYPKIMSLSLILFNNLIKNFRRHFREEIPLFIDEVVLKMLESVNNKPETKLYIIRFLSNIVENSKILLEFFLNFDCNPKSTPLVEKIIVTLCSLHFNSQNLARQVREEGVRGHRAEGAREGDPEKRHGLPPAAGLEPRDLHPAVPRARPARAERVDGRPDEREREDDIHRPAEVGAADTGSSTRSRRTRL